MIYMHENEQLSKSAQVNVSGTLFFDLISKRLERHVVSTSKKISYLNFVWS
jgi:hypothetical protein